MCLPGHGEELCLPALLSAAALLPHWVSVVIQQDSEGSHVASHHAVVEGEAEASLLHPIAEEKPQFCGILRFPDEPIQGHVVLRTLRTAEDVKVDLHAKISDPTSPLDSLKQSLEFLAGL